VRGTDPHLEGAALAMVSLHLGLVMDSRKLLGQWRSDLRSPSFSSSSSNRDARC
jgi:hypothetical protein